MFLMDAEARFTARMHAKKREEASHEPSNLPSGFGALKIPGSAAAPAAVRRALAPNLGVARILF